MGVPCFDAKMLAGSMKRIRTMYGMEEKKAKGKSGAAPSILTSRQRWVFCSLPNMVLMLFIHPASAFASKPGTPISLAFSAITLCFFSFRLVCTCRHLCCTGWMISPPLRKVHLLSRVEHLGDGVFLLPVASFAEFSSSSLPEGGASVCVGYTD